MIRTATPSLASHSASTRPVGPAPTISTWHAVHGLSSSGFGWIDQQPRSARRACCAARAGRSGAPASPNTARNSAPITIGPIRLKA